ncbi:hypothetical protein [Opitutus terrae]|uniref:Uncharacterized protein n=1 Tax=Opitutus terrae (strain DSM 11246 / JCM 15787 / PB90-1) TaxID=452637 RepID=B1ZQD3_OPITP|nr:hypothetical protein [Opitutus terrae]ACB73613.1 hypothetical protein Oter_0323 [Opitutus terrae PB90-1]
MPDRAEFLARTLIARLVSLQESRAEDGRSAPDRAERIATLEKVLVVELGLTDSSTLSLIEAAVPDLALAQHDSGRELAAFAEFLRRRLGAQLSEPGRP